MGKLEGLLLLKPRALLSRGTAQDSSRITRHGSHELPPRQAQAHALRVGAVLRGQAQRVRRSAARDQISAQTSPFSWMQRVQFWIPCCPPCLFEAVSGLQRCPSHYHKDADCKIEPARGARAAHSPRVRFSDRNLDSGKSCVRAFSVICIVGWQLAMCSSPTRATGRLCRAGPGLSRSRLLPASALRIRARTQWSVVVRCGRFVCARRRFRLFVYGFDGFRPDRTPPPRPRVPVRRSQSATLAQAHTCADRAHAKPPVPSRAPSPAPHRSQPIVRNSTPIHAWSPSSEGNA